jgi:hypothetical protein
VRRALKGILVFTGIEVLTMLGWLFFALRGNILGVVILTAGLFVEHYVALQVGAGRPIFGPLPPD